ncbi:hypothetical protein BCR35DRAFT_351648 [Leucosporidium creatinivorum]|uniref:Methyltransferase-domain-containing protein n=1 Tax=Leucosporidium creatinivorum TaxID=106004 RepID=A0A1Y2FMW9_9BASI|nr:hypothetical protein BCR35DRAFT_351648 [Leucosporidium creatinivorum]
MASPALRPPAGLVLPPSFTLIDDADEEIFLLYTRKLSLSPTRSTSSTNDKKDGSTSTSSQGLGFLSATQEVLPISLTFISPYRAATTPAPVAPNGEAAGVGGKVKRVRAARKAAKGGAAKEEKEITVEFELGQDLQALRNRKGDTGSVLWRVSLHLALHLLRHLSFPSPSFPPPLLPSLFLPRSEVTTSLSSSPASPPPPTPLTILELGSGTGFFGLALAPLLASLSADNPTLGRWIFTDLTANLPLIARNLTRNTSRMKDVPTSITELDWIAESALYLSGQHRHRYTPEDPPPSLIIAADCLYNPSLAPPLAHTIARRAGEETLVVVASELRDQEALREFLAAWLEMGREEGDGEGEGRGEWRVGRVGLEEVGEEDEEEGLRGKEFVVWVGWREGRGEGGEIGGEKSNEGDGSEAEA